jgi:hypothetical protein
MIACSAHAAVLCLRGGDEAATRNLQYKAKEARAVEDMLIGMVQQGQIKEIVDEKRGR